MDNKSFVSHLSQRLDIEAEETTRLVDTLVDTFSRIAADGDSIPLPGFGTFQPVKEEEKIVTTPDGKRMLMPPAIRLTFKESVVLRKKLKQS